MKKIAIIILLVFVLSGCSPKREELIINKNNNFVNLSINEKYKIANLIDAEKVNWESSNENVVIIEDDYVVAIGNGQSIVTASFSNNRIVYIFNVEDVVNNITITGVPNIKIGETFQFNATVYPESTPQDVIWESSDEEVITVDSNGMVTGVEYGFARIIATSKINKEFKDEFYVFVDEKSLVVDFKEFVNNIYKSKEIININDYRFLNPITKNSSGSVVGVSGFIYSTKINEGSGVIYKREIHLKNNTVVLDNDIEHLVDDIDFFNYYVVTSEYVLKNVNIAKIYDGRSYIDAEIIAKDPKSDLAVIKFASRLYYPVAIFSDDSIIKGQSVITIGNPNGNDYYQSVTAGIVSSLERYISYDTDNDDIADWGMMFIQHDAAISEGNYGGPLLNLKGEVIAINTKKVISWSIEGMNFAVPIDQVKSYIKILETGEIPKRVAIGIQGVNVIDIKNNPSNYPNYNTYGSTYGFYVQTVVDGLAKNAGIQNDDIIISYNGIKMININDLRSEINKFLLGSGEKVPVIVNRKGTLIELEIVY